MVGNIKLKDTISCLKTGSKAKILDSFTKNIVSYVKVNVLMKFQDTNIQITKTMETDDIQNYFSYS